MYFSGTYCKSSGVSFISVRYRSLALGLPALMSQFSVVNNWCSMSRLPKLANPTDVDYNSFNFAPEIQYAMLSDITSMLICE